MATHQFLVHVPNPDNKSTAVLLSLRPAKKSTIKKLRIATHESALKVTSAFIATAPCAEKGKPELKLRLAPFSSTDVYVTIHTAASARPGAAYFDVVDQRGTKVVGGVLLICQEPAIPDGPGQVVAPRNPCPVVLQSDVYFIIEGDDPTKPVPYNKIPYNASVQLVAPLLNPTGKPLKEAMVYLEHLGISGIEFEPGSWNIGTMQPNDVFYATWTVHIPSHAGALHTSIVVSSQLKDPVRLSSTIEFRRRREG